MTDRCSNTKITIKRYTLKMSLNILSLPPLPMNIPLLKTIIRLSLFFLLSHTFPGMQKTVTRAWAVVV